MRDPAPGHRGERGQLTFSRHPSITSIGICGTAMATLAAMLKRKGLDVRGSDQDVYPPMSDFLAAEGIPAQRLSRRTHHRRPRPGHRRQRHLAREPGARGGAGSEDPLLLAAGGDPRALSLGRALDRDRRHARQDDDDVAGRVAADARRRRSERARRRHREEFRRARVELPAGRGRDFVIEGDEYDSAFFDKTAKFLKYLPDIAVINNVEFDHADIYADIDAVTLAFRRLVNLVPRRGLLLLGADSPGARALKAPPCRASRPSEPARAWTGRRTMSRRTGAATRFRVRRKGSPFGTFEVPLVGAHNVRNALAAIAVATEVGIGVDRIAEGLRLFAGVKRRLEVVGVARRRDGVRRFRPPSDRGGRDAGRASARRIPPRASGPCSSRGRLRRAAACFRTTSPARLPGRTRC